MGAPSPEDCREACQLCEHAYYQHTSTPAEVNALLDPLYAKCGIDGICGGMVFGGLQAVSGDTPCAGCQNPLCAHQSPNRNTLGIVTPPPTPPLSRSCPSSSPSAVPPDPQSRSAGRRGRRRRHKARAGASCGPAVASLALDANIASMISGTSDVRAPMVQLTMVYPPPTFPYFIQTVPFGPSILARPPGVLWMTPSFSYGSYAH
ncbi:hypothetical protein FB107DRAFT_279424 [Schizophyllum commune]